jgi:hypothetical protein
MSVRILEEELRRIAYSEWHSCVARCEGVSGSMAGYLDKIDQNDFQKKEGFQYAQV